jgi:hypothetical protein
MTKRETATINTPTGKTKIYIQKTWQCQANDNQTTSNLLETVSHKSFQLKHLTAHYVYSQVLSVLLYIY